MSQELVTIRLLSSTAYFIWVAVFTTLLIASAMWLRPGFFYLVSDLLRLTRTPAVTPTSFYAVRVEPLLEKHCTGCHGPQRQKASLRLDNFAAAMRGGKHGAVIKPKDVKQSELITRIRLPPTDTRAMPPEGRQALSKDEINVIELWIAAGASPAQHVSAIKGAPPPPKELTFPALDLTAVERARAPLTSHVAALQARFPNTIAYVSRGSADLEINASLIGQSFNDADLLALAPLRNRIVRLDLSSTAVTDRSAETIASMSQLRVLRLANTNVSDITIKALEELPSLRSLAVSEPRVHPQALQPLRSRGIAIYDGSNAD